MKKVYLFLYLILSIQSPLFSKSTPDDLRDVVFESFEKDLLDKFFEDLGPTSAAYRDAIIICLHAVAELGAAEWMQKINIYEDILSPNASFRKSPGGVKILQKMNLAERMNINKKDIERWENTALCGTIQFLQSN